MQSKLSSEKALANDMDRLEEYALGKQGSTTENELSMISLVEFVIEYKIYQCGCRYRSLNSEEETMIRV